MGHRRATKRTKNLIACVAIVMLATVITFALIWFHRWPVRHFDVVQEGVLYRGGQPDETALEYIISQYKIKTVVNLRGRCPDQEWWRLEQEICRRRGVRMIDVPIGSTGATAAGLKQFLAIATDTSSGPVYVHCEAGSSRTGYAVAAYRIVAQGWNYDLAINEAVKFRFNPQLRPNYEYDTILHKLAAGTDWRQLDDKAVPLHATNMAVAKE